jgi:hypothetical protein
MVEAAAAFSCFGFRDVIKSMLIEPILCHMSVFG